MTGVQLAVVDVVDVAGPPTHAVAAVESWAQTLASPATRRSYRAAVRALLLASRGEITPAALAAWRDEMAACDLARATIRQRIAAVRAFAAWAARTGAPPAELAASLALVANELADGDVIPAALAHPHALRHGFALRYLSPPEPGPLSRVQQLLGHDDIATTARYLAAVDERRAPAPRDPWTR